MQRKKKWKTNGKNCHANVKRPQKITAKNKQKDYFIIFKFQIYMCHMQQATYVATLALGLRPKQKLAKERAKSEAQDSHIMISGVWGNEPHTPKWAPTLGVGVLMDS